MKKINITFSFRDETGDYSVKVFPFVIKCIVSVIVVFNFIVIAMALPGEISDHVKYSGKEYSAAAGIALNRMPAIWTQLCGIYC